MEAAARTEHCAGETSEGMAVWSSGHRPSPLGQEVWYPLLLLFLTSWTSPSAPHETRKQSTTTSLKAEEHCTKPKGFRFGVVCFPLCRCLPLRGEKQ